jgi:hypothetical protein
MKLGLIFVILVLIELFNYINLHAQEALPQDFIPLPSPKSNATSEDFIPLPSPTSNATTTAKSEDFILPPIAPEDFRGPSITAPDFINPDDTYPHNAKLIAQDIALYNEKEIKDYPLTDLPSSEIKAVFRVLDSGNIIKILLNIPVNDLKEIQNTLSEEEFNNILTRISIEKQTQIKERIISPVLIPSNSFFIPKNALPIYLPNNSLLIENKIGVPTQLPNNSILVPNEGPLSILNQSAFVVNSNYYPPPLNLPNGSLIRSNGEILIPLPTVSILNNTDRPLILPANASHLIGNNTEIKNLILDGSRIVNINDKWFVKLPPNVGTIIVQDKVIDNLPRGTIIVQDKVIENIPRGTIIVPDKVIDILPQRAILIATMKTILN